MRSKKWVAFAGAVIFTAVATISAHGVPYIGGWYCGGWTCTTGVPPHTEKFDACIGIRQNGSDLNVTIDNEILLHGRFQRTVSGVPKGMLSAISCDATVNPVHFHSFVGEIKLNSDSGDGWIRGLFTSDDQGESGEFMMCEFRVMRVNTTQPDITGCSVADQ